MQGSKKLFYGGRELCKNVGHHGLSVVKNFFSKKNWNLDQKINDSKPLIWSYLSIAIINFRFFGRVSKPTKTSNKDHSFYNTVSLKKHLSFYQPQLTQHYKKYAPTRQPKTILTLQIFQQTCFWWVSDKTFALLWVHCTISRYQKTLFSKHLESKCLYIPVNLHKKIFIPEM